jgi:predicted DNA-binding transcriptional regulator AlpA
MATQTYARRPLAAKATPKPPPSGRKLPVEDIILDLKISQRTFYRWKRAGKAPQTFPLPGGGLRVWESDYNAWLQSRGRGGAR